MRLWLLVFLLAFSAFELFPQSADSRFEIFLRKSDNSPQTGSTVSIKNLGTMTDYALSEVVGSPGLYRRDDVPVGMYAVYVNSVLKTTNRFHPTNQIALTLAQIDPDANYQIDTQGLEDESVTTIKVADSVDTEGNIYKYTFEGKGNQYLNHYSNINFILSPTFYNGGTATLDMDDVFFEYEQTQIQEIVNNTFSDFGKRYKLIHFKTNSARTGERISNFQFLDNSLMTNDVFSLAVKVLAASDINSFSMYFYVRDQDGSLENFGAHTQALTGGIVKQFKIENKTITKTNPVAFWVGFWDNTETEDNDIYIGDISVYKQATALLNPADADYKLKTINHYPADSSGNFILSLSSDSTINIIENADGSFGFDVKNFQADSATLDMPAGFLGIDTVDRAVYTKIIGNKTRLLTRDDDIFNNFINHRNYTGNDPEFNGTYVHIQDHSWSTSQYDVQNFTEPPTDFDPTISRTYYWDLNSSRVATNFARYTSTMKQDSLAPGDKVSIHVEWQCNASISLTMRVYAKLDSINNGSNITQIGIRTLSVSADTPTSFDIADMTIPANTKIFYVFFYDDMGADRHHYIGNMILSKSSTVISRIPFKSFVASINGMRVKNTVSIEAGANIGITTQADLGKLTISAVSSSSRRIENYFYDSTFEIANDWDDQDTVNFVFWDEMTVGSSKLTRPVGYGDKSKYILNLKSGASGANAYVSQTVWFWNNDNIMPDDSFYVGAYLNSGGNGTGQVAIAFLDRSEATIGSEVTANTSGSAIWEWVTASGDIPDDCFGVKVSFKITANNDSLLIAQPMASNVFTTKWINSGDELQNFAFAQNLARKLRQGNNVEIHAWGNSITHSGDDSTRHAGSSYSSKIKTWLDAKFGITSVKRNFGTDGSWEEKTLFLMNSFSLDNNPDFIMLADGRNRINDSFAAYFGSDSLRLMWYEATVRMIKNTSPKTDICLFMPSPQKLGETSAITTNFYKDKKWVMQNKEIASLYGVGTLGTFDQVISVANRGFVDWDLWFGADGNFEQTHPAGIWQTMVLDQFKKVVGASIKYCSWNDHSVPDYYLIDASAPFDSAKFISIADPGITFYGSWEDDGTVTITNGTLDYTVLGGTALGYFDHPQISSAANDSLVFDFTGTQLGIVFIGGAGRGTANIEIDGDPYSVTTATSVGLAAKWRTWDESSPVTLSNGSHHVKVYANNASPISILGFFTNGVAE